MNINTKKIKAEMKRMGMTLDSLGQTMRPKTNRQGAWHLIRYAKTLKAIDKVARALGMNGRDLIE